MKLAWPKPYRVPCLCFDYKLQSLQNLQHQHRLSEPVAVIIGLASEEPEEESASGPRKESTRENEIMRKELFEEQCVKDTLVKPEESNLDAEAELFICFVEENDTLI